VNSIDESRAQVGLVAALRDPLAHGNLTSQQCELPRQPQTSCLPYQVTLRDALPKTPRMILVADRTVAQVVFVSSSDCVVLDC
jgi:hypothetical protein